MAGQTATMEFPVSINAQISNLKDLRTTLINTLNAAGKDSSLAKTLTKDLAKVNQLISEAEEFTLSPTIDAAGLKALEGTFNKFFRQMQTSLQTIDLASFEQMASADDIARLKELTAEAAKYRRELEAINKSGSAEQTGKVLERTGNQDIAQRGSAYKEFNATATLNKNAAAMGKAADAYAQQAAAMQAGIDKLAQELSQAEANSEKAKNKAKILEQNLAAVNIDTRAADFHHKAGRFATNYSAEQNVKNPTLDTIQSGLRATLESVYAGGKIATDMRATVKDWIKNLLPNVKDVDADNMVKKSVNDLLEDLMEGIFGSDYRSNPNLSYNVHHARILGNAQSYSAREIGRINAQYGVSGGQDLKVISAGISRELKQVRAEEREYTSEVDKKLTSWDEATDRQKEFAEAAAGARQLANELENLAKAEQEAARAAKEAQIEENEQNQLDLKNARTSGVKNSGAPGRQKMGDYKTDAKEVFDDAGEVLGGKQAQIDEAAQFTANLKQSIKSWMSAQQIINIVKQGIRQAYQDIQDLDKAMTNIAVVTDMSVGDLWGKINEYMSVAQQYGVSTQGVYEVSQLYYQQGLGTADVMAATTETLKMARIAGMDYAEAADAMTVAIRSFKMEMSDAAHVTDVYSKVAAVTASDSEELAIAMSKTASSAESVGSSFENTTAMLAVMIETTRESAQNLGSALKSIISRYGEMKVGMTVDAEGEALDYNKVDTALKSVGISIKDAQGQFRDFDEVIFELSEKWDSLDSVTQRYIATIMAGNRQQSRFIALVDNWERLDEVAGAAQDSEDAGLLQYAKTLDSLETKITNIKTSFQEFYMSLVNGPVVGAALEGINNILKGFNKLGNWQAILNIAGFIRSVKSIAKLLVSAISPSFSSIVSDFKSSMQEMVEVARQKGYEAGKGYSENYNAGANGQPAPTSGSGSTPAQQSWLSVRMIGDKSGKTSWGSNSWNGSKMAGLVQIGGQLIGTAASIIGSSVAKDNQRAGAVISGVGNIAQGASMGAALGPWGAVIGGVIGGLASLPAVLDAFDPASVLKEKLEKAEEALAEANIEKAETKDRYNKLNSYITKLQQLEPARFDSSENYEEWIKVNAEALEAFPELASTFDEANNAIVNLQNAEEQLTQARLEAANAAKDAADKQIAVALANQAQQQHEASEKRKELSGLAGIQLSAQQLKDGTTEYNTVWHAVEGTYDFFGSGTQSSNYLKQNGVGSTWWSINQEKKNELAFNGQQVYGVWNDAGYWPGTDKKENKFKLMTTNQTWAEAAEFIDLSNSEALAWWVSLANITDDAEFAQQFGKTFSSSFLKEGKTEADLVSSMTNKKYKTAQGLAAVFPTLERATSQTDAAVQSALRSGINAYLSSNLLGMDDSETYTGLNNVNKILQEELYNSFLEYTKLDQNKDLDTGTLWSNWTTQENGYYSKFNELDKLYSNFYKQLKISGAIEEYNAFMANADSYNLMEFEAQLENFNLNKTEGLGEILYKQFEEEYNSARETFIESLKNVDFINKRDTGKVDEAGKAIYELEKEPVNIPKEYMNEVTAFARKVQGYVDNGMMSDISADSLWDQYLAIWNTIDSTGTETQQAILRRLFGSADLTTPEGVAALEQAIQAETGLEGLGSDTINGLIEQAKGLIPNSLVNLNASYNSLMSNVATNIDAQASALSKAGDGFSNLADLQEFTDKSGLDLSDFVFDDGKWYLNYTEETAERIRESVEQNYETQKELIKKSNDEQVKLIENTNLTYTSGDTKTAEQVAASFSGDDTTNTEIRAVIGQHWNNYVAWIEEDNSNTGKTFAEYLSTYYANQLENLDAQSDEYIEWAQKEFEKAGKESKRQRAIDALTDALDGTFEAQKKLEAWNSIISQGLTGYTAENIAILRHDLGISNLGVIQADGTYNIALSQLQDIPTWVSNAITALIASEAKAAKESLISLSNSVSQGKGEANASDYLEFFTHLKDDVNFEDIVSAAYAEILSGDASKLAKLIKDEYTARGIEIDDTQLEALTREATAAYIDGQLERFKSTNDLILQYITGEINEQDYLKLQTELGNDIEKFSETTEDSILNYTTRILKNTALTFKEKLESLGEGYEILIDDLFGKKDAAYNITNTAFENKNRYSMKDLPSLMSYIRMTLGEQDWESLFNYNVADNTYTVNAENLENKLDADQVIFEAYKKLFEASSELGKEAQFNALLEAITTFASGQETTVEGLINTYKELGLSLNPDHADELIAGGSESIIEDLKTQFTDGNETLIAEAVEEGTYTLFESIAGILQSAIEGSASYADIKTLAQATGLDLTGYLISTGYGTYGINQQGALAVSSYRAEKTEDYIGEAISLLDAYYDEGIFENFKSLEDTIQALEDATKEQIEVTEDQIASDKETNETSKELAKEQKKAQLEILRVAQGIYEYRKASEAANFMGTDPFGGALADYDAYLNSRKIAKQVLEEAYNNKGVIVDYTQAAQLLNFISYGEDWSDSQKIRNQNILLKYTSDEGTDFVSALSEIFGQDFANVAEALGEAAEKMDNSANKLEEFYNTRATADEAYLDGMKVVQERLAREEKQGTIPTAPDSWEDLESFISKNYKEILNDTFTAKDILKLQFGKDYANIDYNADTIQTYLEGFIESVRGFIYDPNSELTAQQQFTSHLKGLQESTELEARLQALEDRLKGIKELGITDPIVSGLAEAITQAEELRKILEASGIKIELPSEEPDNVMNPEEEETARGLNISSQANSKLDTQLAELKAKNEDLTAQVTSLSSTVSDQNIILETLQGQNEGLVVEVDNLKAANEAQKTELNAANVELEALETENTNLLGQITDRNASIGGLNNKITELKTEITELTTEKEEEKTNLSGQIIEKEGAITELNAKITELEIGKEALTTQINKAAEQLKSSQDKNEELTTLIDTLNKQKLGADAEKARLEGEVARLTGEKTALEIQLKNKEKEYNELLKRKSISEQGENTQPVPTPALPPPPAAPQNTPAPPSDLEEEASRKEAEQHAWEVVWAQQIEGSQLLSSMWNFSNDNIQLETSIDEFDQLLTDLTNQSSEIVATAYERVKELYAEWERQKEILNNQATDSETRASSNPAQSSSVQTSQEPSIITPKIDIEEQITQVANEIGEITPTMLIKGDGGPALATGEAVRRTLGELPAVIPVYGYYKGMLDGGGGSPGDPASTIFFNYDSPLIIKGLGQYAGNVNGLAYANGNVDSLIAGANFANKTLVGELGPELGVWDGMYHLLGQNGAEFVNMPDDAIVFNHRQTEGILKGQQGYRGRALANGTGETFDKVLLPQWGAGVTFADIVSGFTGNNGKKIETTEIEGLEEWYNLLRKIAKLESEINLIRAERENIYDGHDYLKNLREEQASLNEQIAVQKLLVDYQREQLQLERERIEQNKFWSESLTFNEDGTLLSVFGNETKGGKGVFAFLDQLKELDGNSQLQLIEKMGYTYKGRDGKQLDGQELVQQFIKEYQDIVGSYNELDTSILEAETTIQELITEINSLEQAIKDNQKELEKTIYDILVDAAELEIEQMEEQNELMKEANQKYVEGLSNALSKEQQLYEENKSIEEREALQRQLALLRRSGGSASEIEALEQQLDDTLKNEYFNKQQQMIEDISKANERQAELLEQQVKLQQDALEYQKENGVIWTKVYEVMSGSYEEILAFFTGQDTEFFEASALVQETMLLDWAKMIGIYDEDRGSKAMTAEAQSHWEDGAVLSNLTEEQRGHYAKLSDQDKTAAQKHYNSVYASSRLNGMADEEARKAARASMAERLRVNEELGITYWDPHGEAVQKPSGYSDGKMVYYGGYKLDGTFIGGDECYAENENIAANYAKGKEIDITSRNTYRTGSSPIGPWKKWYIESPTNGRLSSQGYDTEIEAEKQINFKKNDLKVKQKKGLPIAIEDLFWKDAVAKLYKTGGIVDYTGLAMVHGSKSKPESFLNSDQTAQITQALRETTGKESILGSLQSTMEKLKSTIYSISTLGNSNTQSISIAPGAVVIQVEQLADSYDIEEVSRDVMNRMVAIANKVTNRGVNRR